MGVMSRIANKVSRHKMQELEIIEGHGLVKVMVGGMLPVELVFNLKDYKVSLSSDQRSMIVEQTKTHPSPYTFRLANTVGGEKRSTKAGELAVNKQYELVRLEGKVVETICTTNWRNRSSR